MICIQIKDYILVNVGVISIVTGISLLSSLVILIFKTICK